MYREPLEFVIAAISTNGAIPRNPAGPQTLPTPGGLVIIPLVIAVVLATFVPQVFQIGGYVTALFYEGNSCMMVLSLPVCSSTLEIIIPSPALILSALIPCA